MRRFAKVGLLLLALALDNGFTIIPASGKSLSLAERDSLALVGARIYPSPSAKPINNGIVLIRRGKIIAVGEKR